MRILLIVPCVFATQAAAQSVPPPIKGLGYALTFNEHFATNDICSGPTAQNDQCQVPNASPGPGPYVWFNGTEQCCMSPQETGGGQILYGVGSMYPTTPPGQKKPFYPYSVGKTGGLQIHARDFHASPGENGQNWASGVLTSVDEFGSGESFQYGYVQVVARLPATKANVDGYGSWSAFWLLNTANVTHVNNTVGEIDILENYGQFPTAFCTTLHDWTGGTTPFQQCLGAYPDGTPYPDLTAKNHTYGMLWTASVMSFYLDNQFLYSTPTPAVMQGQPYYLLLDLGIGGGWDSNLTPNPSKLGISSVEVWQQ